MRTPRGSFATYILIFISYGLCWYAQPTAEGVQCLSGETSSIHACKGRKRSDIDYSAKVTNLERDGELSGKQGAREAERREEESARENDDRRSEVNDHKGLLEEGELFVLGKSESHPRPVDSAHGRLWSMLIEAAAADANNRTEERQWQDEKQEPARRSRTDDTDRRYISQDTLMTLKKILDDIDRSLDSQTSLNKKEVHDTSEDDN